MPRPKVQRNEIKYKYVKHEVVWAKTAGYRWWPASITCTPSKNKCFYKVDFIGDRSYALLSEQKLAKYLDYRSQYEVNKKNDKHFSNAVAVAARKYQQLIAKQEGVMKGKGPKEWKTSQQKQQLNKQIQLSLIPENLQQLSSFHQSVNLCDPSQNPLLNLNSKVSTQPIQKTQLADQVFLPQPQPTEIALNQPSSSESVMENDKKQKLIEQLLIKYKLHLIPSLKQHRKTQKQSCGNEKKKSNLKRKLISKNRQNSRQYDEEQMDEDQLLTRKIYRFLMVKLHNMTQCQNIALSLKEQIIREKIQKVDCLRKVVEWISMTDPQNIVSYHSQWINFYKENEREREKHSNLTMEDQLEDISMK